MPDLTLRFSALIPEATINYITNPALRYDTTGWNAQGSTITRTLDRARFGIASLKVVTNAASLREGAYFRVSALVGISESITISVYVRGTGKVRIRLDNNVVGGTEYVSDTMEIKDLNWTRLSVTGFSTGGNDMRLYVETDESTLTARTFYVDGAQMERKAYATTYCDGEQPGCRWNGLYHGSTSQRDPYTRAGGRWVQLAGEEREAENLYMTVVTGLGKAPIVNNLQSYALAPGAYYQNTKINAREVALTFHAKHVVEDADQPISLSALHQLRELLIDVVKPDRTVGGEEIWFEYDDGNTPLYFQARYNGGLEGEWDIRNQFVNSFPLRLLAVSPLMLEDNQEVATIDFQDSFLLQTYLTGRIDGTWSRLNFGADNDVQALALGPKGEVYIAGYFTVVNNNAAAIDPLRTARVAYWDGEKWVAIATSTVASGAAIHAVAVAANGDVYVTGEFTTINGVAANRIAKWNGSTWSALGTGLNNLSFALAIAPNGDVYVGGDFTTAGGVACVRIARWDGLQWRRVGQFGGLSGRVQAIAINQDGTLLYAGGQFTTENGGGATLNSVAQYNITAGTFSAMGGGFSDQVYTVKVSKAGVLYAGGQFTASGSTSLNYIAQWNGTAWVSLSSGFGPTASLVLDIDTFDNENILAAGSFLTIGGNAANRVALWNGSTWTPFDVNPSLTSTAFFVNTCLIDKKQDVFLGFNSGSNGPFEYAGITTVTNPGSTEARPIIYLKGQGTLLWIENQTTHKRLFFNLIIQNNEDVFIDCAQGTIYSTVRGSLLYTLLAGSEFRSFTLLPGDNKLSCFMRNDVGALMQMSFRPAHWSVDATQHGESF